MPVPRHRRRTLKAGVISACLHVLIAFLIGIRFNWFPKPIRIEPDSTIQVTFHAGLLPIPAPARPMLVPSPEEEESPEPPSAKPKPKRSEQPKPVTPMPAFPSPAVKVASSVGVPDSAIQTAAETSSEGTSPLIAESDLLITEQGSPAADSVESAAMPSEEPPAEAGSPDGEDEELPGVEEQMRHAIRDVTGHMVSGNGSGVVDIVFLIDTSGSMYDNILAVGANLGYMASMLEQHGLDYRVGLVKFKYSMASLRVFPMTADVSKFQRVLANTTQVGGPERAYDALIEALKRVQFRPEADKAFVLVTDEPLAGSYTARDVWRSCLKQGVRVSVIGLDDPFHHRLAEATGGLWSPIPTNPY